MFKKRILTILLAALLIMVLAVGVTAADRSIAPGTWNAAPVVADKEQVSFIPNTYSNTITDNQVWMAFNVAEANQAIQLELEGLEKANQIYLFPQSVLEAGNFNWNSALVNWYCSGSATYQYKVDAAGVYYVLVRPSYSNYTSEKAAAITLSLVNGDLNENNDTWQNATELTENVNTYYNLAGQNDVDWFKITTSVPGEAIKLQFSNFDYTVANIDACLFTQAQVDANATGNYEAAWYWHNFSTAGASNYKANEPGTYYLRINPHYGNDYIVKDLKLSYTTVQPDANELNDSYDTATTIGYAYPMSFTLNGINDEDWFYFETTKPNEVVYFYLSGFETDYSNNIGYDIYDAAEDGVGSRLYYENYIDITYSSVYSFANVGGHYIKLTNYDDEAVENALTLRIEKGVADGHEPNDTYEQAIPMAENTPVSFNLPSNADVDWFKFSVTEPNQTVELTLKTPSAVVVELYSGVDFTENGSNAGSITCGYLYNKTNIMRHTLEDAGEYYVRVQNNGSGSFEEYATLSYALMAPDANEYNNHWKNATTLNEGVATEYNLPSNGDGDWFKFTATEPNQTVELTSNVPKGGYIYVALHSHADFMEQGDRAGSIAHWYVSDGEHVMRHMLGEAGDYYLYIGMNGGGYFDDMATISYSLIDPEENERNNTWETATTLNAGVDMGYHLYATNDEDWFKFTTTKDNQTVELTSNLPEGGYIYVALHSYADFRDYGNNAGSVAHWYVREGKDVMRHMLGEAGDYYVYVGVNGNSYFDEEATISYTLIDPDANERNNKYTTATELAQGEAVYYTLPAYNDDDYFYIGSMTAGDVLLTTLGDLPDFNVGVNLYVLEEGSVDLRQVGYHYVRQGLLNVKWNIETDGEYYLALYNWSDNQWGDQTMWLRYAITALDKPVEGINSISNGDTTIFEGKGLQLYANINPSNATNQNVTWTTSDESVATIDEYTGRVTGVKPGTVTITATTEDGGYTAKTTITVVEAVPVTGVTVTAGDVAQKGETEDNPYYLALDTSVSLTASVLPETATEQAVTWSSSNPDVAVVNIYGQAFAVGSGEAVITATTVDGGKTANFYIDVPDETYPVRGISLNYNAATLYMGEEGLDLVATVNPSYATNPAVKWSSDNESVATVDQNGHVTVVGTGYANITVAAVENDAVKNTCVVAVLPPRIRVTDISFEKTEIEVGIYATAQLTPIITPIDATDKSVTWTSSNKTVATVSRNGLVNALNIGSAVITATTNDGKLVAEITVKVASTAAVGDLNNDGDADAGDALLILRYNVGLVKLSEAQMAVADVNGDGEVDAGDSILILRYDAGLIDKFPAEEE